MRRSRSLTSLLCLTLALASAGPVRASEDEAALRAASNALVEGSSEERAAGAETLAVHLDGRGHDSLRFLNGALAHRDSRVRQAATGVLVRAFGDPDLNQLLATMTGASRAAAVHLIGATAADDAALCEHVVFALGDEVPVVRIAAARVLPYVAHRPAGAEPTLRRLAASEYEPESVAAAGALAFVGTNGREAFESFLTNPGMRVRACRGLAELGEQGRDKLGRLGRHDDWRVRAAVAEALGLTGVVDGSDEHRILAKLAFDDEVVQVRAAARGAIARLGIGVLHLDDRLKRLRTMHDTRRLGEPDRPNAPDGPSALGLERLEYAFLEPAPPDALSGLIETMRRSRSAEVRRILVRGFHVMTEGRSDVSVYIAGLAEVSEPEIAGEAARAVHWFARSHELPRSTRDVLERIVVSGGPAALDAAAALAISGAGDGRMASAIAPHMHCTDMPVWPQGPLSDYTPANRWRNLRAGGARVEGRVPPTLRPVPTFGWTEYAEALAKIGHDAVPALRPLLDGETLGTRVNGLWLLALTAPDSPVVRALLAERMRNETDTTQFVAAAGAAHAGVHRSEAAIILLDWYWTGRRSEGSYLTDRVADGTRPAAAAAESSLERVGAEVVLEVLFGPRERTDGGRDVFLDVPALQVHAARIAVDREGEERVQALSVLPSGKRLTAEARAALEPIADDPTVAKLLGR